MLTSFYQIEPRTAKPIRPRRRTYVHQGLVIYIVLLLNHDG